VGLQSFMHEESNAIGSLSATAAERRRLAAASHAFNRKNAIWRELFGGGPRGDSGGTGGGGGAGEDETGAAESLCRFCFMSRGELVAPCLCKGSNEWVHLDCLRAWQKSVLLSQPTHPKYQVCSSGVSTLPP